MVLLGWGAWRVQSALSENERQLQAAQVTIDGLSADVAARDVRIGELDAQVTELQAEVQRLQAALRLLKVDHRLARLTVAARTGVGAPGTSFAGQGVGGTVAVAGTSGGDGEATGEYLVAGIAVNAVKSQAVADQFVNWQIATTRGLVLSGLIVEETSDAVTLRDANGKDTRIDKKEIDTREKNPASLMPDNLVSAITEDELVDLVEYLATLRTAAKACGEMPTCLEFIKECSAERRAIRFCSSITRAA